MLSTDENGVLHSHELLKRDAARGRKICPRNRTVDGGLLFPEVVVTAVIDRRRCVQT
jgi:hypothetical protein